MSSQYTLYQDETDSNASDSRLKGDLFNGVNRQQDDLLSRDTCK